MSKARVAAFEAALTDRVHLGADNYGPVVGRTTRAMGDGRTLQQTRCHCGSIWDGHTWGPGKKEWEAHVGSMKHLAWVQSTHEVVIEMWAGDVCGLEDAERAEAIRRAVELSGVHGARVLVPDAHVSLRVRPCCDVMVAHLRVWQHFSIDHPVYGRYSTAVHIS